MLGTADSLQKEAKQEGEVRVSLNGRAAPLQEDEEARQSSSGHQCSSSFAPLQANGAGLKPIGRIKSREGQS